MHARFTARTAARILLIAQGFWMALPACGADDLATRQRVDEALSLQRKGRDDLASDVWRKLLILDPGQRDALVNLGLIEARAGHTDEALALLARARRQSPRPRGLAQLEAALRGQVAAQPSVEVAGTASTESAGSADAEARHERKERRKHRKTSEPQAVKARAKALAPSLPEPPTTAAAAPTPAPSVAEVAVSPATAQAKSASLPPVRAAAAPPPPEPPPTPSIATLPKPRPTKALPFLPPPV